MAAAGGGVGLTPLASAVGVASAPLPVVDSRSFYVVGDLKQPKGEGAIAALKAKNPNVLFAIARSKNLNIVVYEALVNPNAPTKLATGSSGAVDVYWVDLDAAYAVENRKKGIPHDREDLNFFERKMAYGASTTERKAKPGTFDLSLVAVSGRAIVLAIDPKANRPRAYITLKSGSGKDVECVLERIFVHTIDTWTGPDVDWYEICGTATADGTQIIEKVVRK